MSYPAKAGYPVTPTGDLNDAVPQVEARGYWIARSSRRSSRAMTDENRTLETEH
jgi:hypothetical protein